MHTSQKQHQSLAFKQFQIEDVLDLFILKCGQIFRCFCKSPSKLDRLFYLNSVYSSSSPYLGI